MNNLHDFPALLTVPELAKFLRVGKNKAYRLVSTHTIKSLRIGNTIRIPRKALLEYLDQAN